MVKFPMSKDDVCLAWFPKILRHKMGLRYKVVMPLCRPKIQQYPGNFPFTFPVYYWHTLVYILCQSTQAAPSVLTIICALFARKHRNCHNDHNDHNDHNGQIVNQSPVTMWQRNNMGKDIAKKLTKKTTRSVDIAFFGNLISRFLPHILRDIGCYFPITVGNSKCGNLHSLVGSVFVFVKYNHPIFFVCCCL